MGGSPSRMAPQLDRGQMQPLVSQNDSPTIVVEVRLELQHLLLQSLPVPVAAQTQQLQRVWHLAVGKAVHREPLGLVVVRHLGQVVAAVLRWRWRKGTTAAYSEKHSKHRRWPQDSSTIKSMSPQKASISHQSGSSPSGGAGGARFRLGSAEHAWLHSCT